LKRALILPSFLVPASLLLLSCGGSSGTSPTPPVASRAFVSQNVTTGSVFAGLQVIDADRDTRVFQSPITAGATPGMMVVTPNRSQTLVFSPIGNNLALVSNSSETATSNVTLPGFTESFVVSPDSRTAYVAVPTAPEVAQSPGVVEVVNLSNGNVTAQIFCPPGNPSPAVCAYSPSVPPGSNLQYHYLAIGNSGNRLLAFSDNSNTVAVITPANAGTNQPVITFVDGFDRPVAAFFNSNDSTAYVVNCGAECGGTQASVQILDLTPAVPVSGTAAAVPAATAAVISGATMYVAGTPVPASPCTGQTTAATTCGLLSIVDLTNMTVVNPDPIVITDGYHNRIALGANGQLFVGAHSCAEIIPSIPPQPNQEVRGCLSIFNSQTGAVVIPPANGDVTGIQPIAKRSVVYLVQGGELQIYDTTTAALLPKDKQIDISGQAVDVKTVDF
jgi:hypothetical protein